MTDNTAPSPDRLPGAGSTHGTVQAGGYTLDHATAGPEDPAAVLVSLPGSAGLEMSTAEDQLAGHHRGIELDPPGWGARDDVGAEMHQPQLGPILTEAAERLTDGSFFLPDLDRRPAVRIVGFRHRAGDGAGGPVQVGALTEDGVTAVAGLEEFWAGAAAHLAAQPTGERHALADVELVPPVLPGARVVCIGLNYLKHVAEGSFSDQALPEHPTLFARWTQSLSVGGVGVPVPVDEDGLDWEGEVVAYVGTTLVDATPEDALAAVVGYSTFNDITARRAQKLTSQWILGKNADRSGPLGPIVPAAEVGDLRDGLRVRTRVNGETVQDGSTDEMVYTVGDTLALISRTFTLRPGDLLATGTPSGVGYARDPQWLLHPGDVVEVEIDKLGTLTTPVVADR